MTRSELIDRIWQAVGILVVTAVGILVVTGVLTAVALAWAWDSLNAP